MSVHQRRTTKNLHTRLSSHVFACTLTHVGQDARISSAPYSEDELACTCMIHDSKPVGIWGDLLNHCTSHIGRRLFLFNIQAHVTLVLRMHALPQQSGYSSQEFIAVCSEHQV